MELRQDDIDRFKTIATKWKELPCSKQKKFKDAIKKQQELADGLFTRHAHQFVEICKAFGNKRARINPNKEISDIFSKTYDELHVQDDLSRDRSTTSRIYLAPYLFWFTYHFEEEAKTYIEWLGWTFEPIKDYEFDREIPRVAELELDPADITGEPLIVRSDATEHSFYADDALLASLFQKSAAFQSKIIEKYEPHGITDELRKFMDEKPSGVWHLTGEAGTGKTSIIASIADSPPTNAATIAYYFGRGFEATNEPPLNWFYQYAIHALSETYDLPPSGTAQKHYPELFSHILSELSDAGKISTATPLILCLDAIDELIETDTKGVAAARELLSHDLPEGVFIACSQRMRDEDPKSTLKLRRLDYKQANIHAPANFEYTLRATQAFVRGLITRSPAIKSYLQVENDSDPRIDECVESQCKAAKYNFMLLRLVFSDPTCWPKNGQMFDITSDLDGYYEHLHDRMSQKNERRIGSGSHSITMRASYCFALLKRMTRKTFMSLMGQRWNPSVADEANDALEGWIKQGLIYEQEDWDQKWLSVYHYTYRKYLRTKLLKRDMSEFMVPFANCLIDDFDLEGDLREMETDSPEACSGWVELILYVLTNANKTKQLEHVLTNLRFAQMACRTRDGLSLILDKLSDVTVTPYSKQDFEDALRSGATALLDWSDKGLLQDQSGGCYTYISLKQMAGNAFPNLRQPNTLAISQFIVHPNRTS